MYEYLESPEFITHRANQMAECEKELELYAKNLNYEVLAAIKMKHISELIDSDLEQIGILKYQNCKPGAEYYCYSILQQSLKLYFNRNEDGSFDTWHWKPNGVLRITTTEQLLDEAITKWKLRLKPSQF